MTLADYDPRIHYDHVTPAWTLFMGPDLHYGYFAKGVDDLEMATRELTRRLMSHGRILPDLDVLDVGCGTGSPACLLAAEHGCRVTGISTSEVGLAEARRKAQSRGLSAMVKFLYADGMANGLPDASFDRVWVMQASHFMPHKDRLFAESARVLRPSGRIVLCDIMLHAPLPMVEIVKHRGEFLLLNRVFGRAKMEPMESYRTWATASGLRVDVLEDVSAETFPTFERWRRNAHRHRETAQGLIGEPLWRDFVDACGVLERFWKDRVLGYGIVAAVKD